MRRATLIAFVVCLLSLRSASAAPNDLLLVDLPGAVGSTGLWTSFTGGYTSASGEGCPQHILVRMH